MLKKIISLTVSFIVIVTGLILTDNVIPTLSEYLGYDLHGNGIFGISFAYIGLGLLGVGLFAWLALVLEPFITNSICNASERWTAALSRVPTSDILVIVFGVGIPFSFKSTGCNYSSFYISVNNISLYCAIKYNIICTVFIKLFNTCFLLFFILPKAKHLMTSIYCDII